MNILQLKTSIKREIWEYQKIFLWLPIFLATIIILTPILTYLFSNSPHLFDAEFIGNLINIQKDEHIANFSLDFIIALFIPFLLVANLVQVHYFVACLYDERRDLSILFWRSLPVSDAMSVGVKLLVGALILPSVFLIVATLILFLFLVLAFIYCTVLSLGFDTSLWGLWASANIITDVFSLWLGLIPYILWLLPLYAWLMLVSMFSSKAPLLWAILPVIFLLAVESFVVNYFHLNHGVIGHYLIDYFSISQNVMAIYSDNNIPASSVVFTVLSEKVSVGGLAIAAAFIYATYWLRSNRSHL